VIRIHFLSFLNLKPLKDTYEKFKTYLNSQTKLKPVEIEHIGEYFSPKTTKRNEILLDYPSVCTDFYFINKGALRIFTLNSQGLESSRFFAFDTMFCTVLPSFIDQRPANEYLQSIEKSELLVCKRADFYELIRQYPELDRLYREILELGFIISQQRIYGFQGFDALEKVQWVIKNQPHLLLRMSNKMAASYLGMSPSTLSRVKAKL
jgi:CRP-like cAMP-binding protein